ncbi:MAG: hemerythrin domain-containing protein [Deltaproteobacteria bacterium]|nr:hemerythrin domain-containing protein [Deltaproteobacteria bacterium]
MAFGGWSFRDDLGIEQVDEDHRRLVELLRRLYDGTAAGWAGAEVAAAFRELAEHARVHFQREELLLEAAACPELPRQRSEHASLLTLLRGLGRAPAELSPQAVEDLGRRLLAHIQEEDRSYADWLARARPEAVAAWARRRALAALPRP